MQCLHSATKGFVPKPARIHPDAALRSTTLMMRFHTTKANGRIAMVMDTAIIRTEIKAMLSQETHWNGRIWTMMDTVIIQMLVQIWPGN